MTGGELVAILAISGTIITGIIQQVFHGTSLSRCKNIDCFCFKCEREVLKDESLYNDTNNTNTKNEINTNQII